MKSSLQQRAETLGLVISDTANAQFATYEDLLCERNQAIDLTAITDRSEIEEKHFFDSLTIFRNLSPTQPARVIDVGTGGGFPGLPMKLVNPALDLVLLDSLQKRIRFLEEVIAACGLSKVKAIHGRAEEWSRKAFYRDAFDLAVSRAVAPLPTLLEYCLPFVRVGGFFHSMKGPAGEEELKQSRPALDALGGRVVKVDRFTFGEENFQRTILVIEKIRPTPAKYPRGQGKPRKAPLRLE